MAFQIIRHAFRIVFGNLGDALKVSVGPYLILTVIAALGVTMIAETGGFLSPNSPVGVDQDMNPSAIFLILGLAVAALFVVSWVAVSWHRFILLEEYPGWLPQLSGRPVWPYVGRSLLYGFVIVLAALPLLFLVGLLASPLLMAGQGLMSILTFIAITGFMTYVWLRIAIALPAVAVGQPISMGDAWRASRGMSGTIFGVAMPPLTVNM